jgi:hypothetical protein
VAALHRIQWIDAQIRAARYPNARRVAERFEISHRQAQRDFEYLRDSLGAPLLYSALRRGYRYDGEAYVLPGPFVRVVVTSWGPAAQSGGVGEDSYGL